MTKEKTKRRLVLSSDSPDGVLELPDGSCQLLLRHMAADEASVVRPTVGGSGGGSGAARKALDRDRGAIENAWRQDSVRAKMRELLSERFSREELRTLCFDLDVDYDDLPCKGKAGKARELAAYVWRRRPKAVSELVLYLKWKRPDVYECLPPEAIEMAEEYSESSRSSFASKGGRGIPAEDRLGF